MGQESTHNQSNQTIVGGDPTKRYNFDVYRFDIEPSTIEMPNDIIFNKDGTVQDRPCTKHIPAFDIEMSNVISWELFRAKMTREELKGLADFIYKYLENNA